MTAGPVKLFHCLDSFPLPPPKDLGEGTQFMDHGWMGE